MVAMLDIAKRGALDAYLAHALPQWPEMSRIVDHVARLHPTSLRIKELFETVEAFLVVGQFFNEKRKLLGLNTILDLACGHGLLGVMLAYRFPDMSVRCVDLEPREAFHHYLEAWAAEGTDQ